MISGLREGLYPSVASDDGKIDVGIGVSCDEPRTYIAIGYDCRDGSERRFFWPCSEDGQGRAMATIPTLTDATVFFRQIESGVATESPRGAPIA